MALKDIRVAAAATGFQTVRIPAVAGLSVASAQIKPDRESDIVEAAHAASSASEDLNHRTPTGDVIKVDFNNMPWDEINKFYAAEAKTAKKGVFPNSVRKRFRARWKEG